MNNYQPKFLPKLDEFIKLIKLWESNPNVSVSVQPRADFGYNDIYVTPQDFWVIQHYLPQYFGKPFRIGGYSPYPDYSKPLHFGNPSDDPTITASEQYKSASVADSLDVSSELSLYKSDSARQAGLMSNPANRGDNQ